MKRTIQKKNQHSNKKLSVILPEDVKITEVIGITEDGQFYKLQSTREAR